MTLPKIADNKTYIKLLICAIMLLICMFAVAPRLSNADTYEKLTDSLNKKRETAIEISAVLAGASVAIAAVPGDATTPVADQIASMNSYLIVVIGAIMLEKFMLPLIGMLVSYIIFPIAIILFATHTYFKKDILIRSSVLLGIFGIILLLVIPTGIIIGDKVDENYGLATLSENIEKDLADISGDVSGTEEKSSTKNSEKSSESNNLLEKAKDFFSDTADNITEGASIQLDKIKIIIGDLLDAVAALLISACIIPILMCLVFFWLGKFLINYAIKIISPSKQD